MTIRKAIAERVVIGAIALGVLLVIAAIGTGWWEEVAVAGVFTFSFALVLRKRTKRRIQIALALSAVGALCIALTYFTVTCIVEFQNAADTAVQVLWVQCEGREASGYGVSPNFRVKNIKPTGRVRWVLWRTFWRQNITAHCEFENGETADARYDFDGPFDRRVRIVIGKDRGVTIVRPS